MNSPVWFIGTEEGGAEVWRFKKKTLKQSLELRSKYSNAMDFTYVWENKYKIRLGDFKGPCVWRFMAAFLLSYEKDELLLNNLPGMIKEYVFCDKKLGSIGGKHFMCELFPLPKPGKNIWPNNYKIWKPSLREYLECIGQQRIAEIIRIIKQNKKVKIIVIYEKKAFDLIQENIKQDNIKIDQMKLSIGKYKLYRMHLAGERSLFILNTPFFGNGRVSYSELNKIAIEVKSRYVA
jgi:hypothetical protein